MDFMIKKSNKELYESSYKEGKHFSFGKNWQNFLLSLNEEKIQNAKKSLTDFLGGEENIKGKTFVDIGCGSGLFSYVAYKLGAKKVVSVDVDEFSVACATHLKEKGGNPENWEIKKGSILDKEFVGSLGQFDVVYSWGVLHHTGDMYRAFDNVVNLVDYSGIFYTSIYGRRVSSRLAGTPEFWLWVKSQYNSSGLFGKKIIDLLYMFYFFIGMLISGKNPIKIINNYKERGMNWYNDVIDWLGGYPYEFAFPYEIINYFGKKDLYCKKLTDRSSLACNEFLFIKKGK